MRAQNSSRLNVLHQKEPVERRSSGSGEFFVSHEQKVATAKNDAPREIRVCAERESRRLFVCARLHIGTQLDAARFLGVSRSTLEDWERGASRIPCWAFVAVQTFKRKRYGT
jgi:hypothetical protein